MYGFLFVLCSMLLLNVNTTPYSVGISPHVFTSGVQDKRCVRCGSAISACRLAHTDSIESVDGPADGVPNFNYFFLLNVHEHVK